MKNFAEFIIIMNCEILLSQRMFAFQKSDKGTFEEVFRSTDEFCGYCNLLDRIYYQIWINCAQITCDGSNVVAVGIIRRLRIPLDSGVNSTLSSNDRITIHISFNKFEFHCATKEKNILRFLELLNY